MSRSELIQELKSTTFKLGSGGFVRFVDVLGDDSAIVQAARISYGDGTKTPSDDNALIRYLMRHRHTTPLEMCEVKLHIRIPMDAWRQFVRHRTANINEYSTRYSEAIDEKAVTDPGAWRLQSGSNKQGSDGFLKEWPDKAEDVLEFPEGLDRRDFIGPGDYLTQQEKQFQEIAGEVYKERLACGVSREQARKDLPLSTYTEAYWKCDLHNIFHFLGLRMEKHAQLEIREYANCIGEQIIAKLFPMAWSAFLDYRLNAITLSALDIQALQCVLGGVDVTHYGNLEKVKSLGAGAFVLNSQGKSRELDEFMEKWKTIVGYYTTESELIG
jgi:thymidylate synthase (FAD)